MCHVAGCYKFISNSHIPYRHHPHQTHVDRRLPENGRMVSGHNPSLEDMAQCTLSSMGNNYLPQDSWVVPKDGWAKVWRLAKAWRSARE